MKEKLKNKLLQILPIQYFFIPIISLFLGFFNSYGHIFYERNGTLVDSFTLIRNVKMIGLSVAFCVIMLVMVILVENITRGYKTDKPIYGRYSKILDNWKQVAIIIIFVWGVILIPFFPAVAGWDIVAQISEMTTVRSSISSENIFNVYPIAHYLTAGTPTMWSNQHGAFLTAIYGLTAKLSWKIFGTFLPAYIFLGFSQFFYAVFSYSYAISFFHKYIKNNFFKFIGIVLIIFNPVIVINSISLNKNPLFAISFVLFTTLVTQLIINKGNVSRIWTYLMLLSTVTGLIAVKWGWLLYLIMGILLLFTFLKTIWKKIVITIILPVTVFKLLLTLLISFGTIIPDDPIEAKGIQIQQIARYVKEYPDGISSSELKVLNKLFVVKNLGELYDPLISDPVKSSGYNKFSNPNKMGYRYKTVKSQDWKQFNKVWLSLLKKHPAVYVDAFMAKTAGYFDFRNKPYNDNPGTIPSDSIRGYGALQEKAHWLYNNKIRSKAIILFESLFQNKVFGFLFYGNFWIIAVLMLFPIFLRCWARMIIIIPVLLQIGVAVLSPVANSERYTLGIIYIGPILILILGISTKVLINQNQKRG
ncbi:DUF6020 family protein [Leuconostoc mesenteroides]|uniref:DUF6020 family protein n=1 Tax=Leuconostoc mesenteroides TaxID=1245 RepID=UPI00065E19A1|nr:DUF6020 family protein [Leuconostoc mesenteroides]AKP35593.1 hypothetical protein NH16_00710 [Leuconostoc mesenteroides subsp. dextranicum]ORI96610.1 hypothetical protein BMT00_00785 [Leuconostoc mesenteroides subsp. mesenteroides]QUY16397.1 hypothetical protein GWG51_06210 [Leuconostoc mesenteroides]WPK14359.1 DUF6020 family protein [Leuconostoc mesenteroides]GEL82662.1 hypothetical protein LME02_06910 [Leuconostoc mesenteroides subsp. dextranicum]